MFTLMIPHCRVEARDAGARTRCDQLQRLGVTDKVCELLGDECMEVRERATTVMHNVDCSNDDDAPQGML